MILGVKICVDAASLGLANNPLANSLDQRGFQAAQTLKWSMFGTFLRPRLSKRRRTRFRLTACHRVITGPMQRVDQQMLRSCVILEEMHPIQNHPWTETEIKFERTACTAPGTGKACTVFKLLVVWWPLVVQMAGPSVFRAHLIQRKLETAYRHVSGFKPRQHKYFRPNSLEKNTPFKQYDTRFIYKIIDTYTKLLIEYPHIYIYRYIWLSKEVSFRKLRVTGFHILTAQRSLRAVGMCAESSCSNFLISPKIIASNWHVPKIEK